MSKYLSIRLIMTPDTTVHVVFRSAKTFACTPNLLSKILSTPTITSLKNNEYIETTRKVNPLGSSFTKVPGLTLARIYSNLEVVCSFPQVFETLFLNLKDKPDEPIELKRYVDNLHNCDEKQLFLKFFCYFINDVAPDAYMSVMSKMTDEEKMSLLEETFNSAMIPILPPTTEEDTDSTPSESTVSPISPLNDTSNATLPADSSQEPISTKEKYYTPKEAAMLLGYSEKSLTALYRHIHLKNIKVLETPGSKFKYRIPQSEIVRWLKEHPRKISQPTLKQPEVGTIEEELKEIVKISAKEVQKKIADCSGLSPKMIGWIKTMTQYKFYRDNGYKEVRWNSRHALIVDVQPNHISERYKISNAQRMSDGKPPVIPGTDYVYEVHHIDQDLNSPFAIITYKNHKELDGQFHKKSKKLKYELDDFGDYKEVEEAELHDKNFEHQKYRFWKEYIEKYKAAGSFENIEGYSLELDKKKNKDNGN